MKILFHSSEKMEVDGAKLLLESRGIPAFIGPNSSGTAIGLPLSIKYTLWVYLDNQHEDALEVLKNPDHEVADPVDLADFEKFIETNNQSSRTSILNGVMLVLVGFVILLFSVFFIYGVTKGT